MSGEIGRAEAAPPPPVTVRRYSALTRINHWTLATSFVLLALSGLALFHPSMFWLATFFGGGPTLRWLHPVIGCVLIVAWLLMFLRFAWANVPEKVDWVWLSKIRDVVSNREENLPEVGKDVPVRGPVRKQSGFSGSRGEAPRGVSSSSRAMPRPFPPMNRDTAGPETAPSPNLPEERSTRSNLQNMSDTTSCGNDSMLKLHKGRNC